MNTITTTTPPTNMLYVYPDLIIQVEKPESNISEEDYLRDKEYWDHFTHLAKTVYLALDKEGDHPDFLTFLIDFNDGKNLYIFYAHDFGYSIFHTDLEKNVIKPIRLYEFDRLCRSNPDYLSVTINPDYGIGYAALTLRSLPLTISIADPII